MNHTLTKPHTVSLSASALRPALLFPLFSAVTSLPGVGDKTRQALERLAGGRVLDLVFHFPTGVIDRRFMPPLSKAPDQGIITAIITVDEHHAPPMRGQTSTKPYRVFCSNDTGVITLVFFKTFPDYIQKQLPIGEQRVISGKAEWSYNSLQMVHPDYIAPLSELASIQKMEPVYPLTYALSQKMLAKTIQHALKRVPALPEWIDSELVKKKQWQDWQSSVLALHQPESTSPKRLRDRLAYDELFANQLGLQLARMRIQKKPGHIIQGNGHLRELLQETLGFTLTDAQQQVLEEIYTDQHARHRMMRLLQGDVGSGKTVVALFAMLNAIECGMQAALMVPTEILARQHAAWISKVTENLGITVALLTGKTKASERKALLTALESGELALIIGTHALFQEDVIFQNLGIAVIDEQHRFGVDQRMSLMKKGHNTDLLLMSATPIPRTLTMALYGDMDVSRITAKPKGRKPIDTRVVSLNKIHEVVMGVERALAAGKKLYWICPLVEESEALDLAAAVARFNEFQKRFGDKVGLVHGKMKAEERDPVMAAFKSGEIQLLIATTVIEVGVDVPDATIMMIEHAERFGLSQLHQLRGRVGRSDLQSSCLLLYDPNTTGYVGKARLKTMRNTEDGFVIAEEDLRLRGAGDVLGTKQSGLPNFKMVDFDAHGELLRTAHQDAKLLLHNDPDLVSLRGQAVRILLYLFEYDNHIHYMRSG